MKTSTMKYSAASWRARRAVLCICRSLFVDMSCMISCTRCWKGAFLMRRSVVFWNFWISLAATVPGHQRRGFLTAIAFCAAACAAFAAKGRCGGAPTVDLWAVYLTRAMVGDVYGWGCSFKACTSHHITIVCVVVIEKPYKKTKTYSSIYTKVNRRKPLSYKMAGELFFPPNVHPLTLIGKRTYIYSHLAKNKQ